MSGKITSANTANENWLPAASARDNPRSRMRRQFQYNLSWSIESVRDGNGCEDGSECSPNGSHFTQTLRTGHVQDRGWGKAVECECDVTAGIAVEATGDIPERASEHDTEEQVRGCGQQRLE